MPPSPGVRGNSIPVLGSYRVNCWMIVTDCWMIVMFCVLKPDQVGPL